MSDGPDDHAPHQPPQQPHQDSVPNHDGHDKDNRNADGLTENAELHPRQHPGHVATGALMSSRDTHEGSAARSLPQHEGGAASHDSNPVVPSLSHLSHPYADGDGGSVFADPRSTSLGGESHQSEMVADPLVPEKTGISATVLSAQPADRSCRPFSPLFRHTPCGFGNVKWKASEDSHHDLTVPPSNVRVADCSQPRTPESMGRYRHHDFSSGSLSTSLCYSDSFVNQTYIKDLPPHLLPLAHEIHNLGEKDLVYIADVTHTMANRDLYSLLPYTGSNWFLPLIRECDEGEKHWEMRYCWKEGLIVSIGGRRLSIRALNIFIRICFLVLVWFLLWNMLPRWLVEPGGYVWDPAVLVVVSAIVGGLICRVLQLPPLVGVLWVGIMWNNIPTLKYLTHGIVKEVYDICSKLGLTVILARAGYKLAVKDIIPHWKQTALLATMPFVFEGISHSLIANKIFNYNNNYNWAFLQGMLCSIVSPAVVVPGSLYLQDMGYGCGVGPLSLMLSAVGIEIVIGVWCANFIIGLIFNDQKLAVAIVLGPVQFIGGIGIGIGLGILFFYVVELIKLEAHRLPNGKYTRAHLNSCMDFAFTIFLLVCYAMVFFGYKMNLAGGGCVMCVFFSATVAHMWSRTRRMEHEDHKKYVATWLAMSWNQVMMPVLFATMGAKIDVKAIFNSSFFPRAIICMACSTVVRFIVTFAIQIGSGMPWKEKLLVCVGYLGKASAQASVGPIAANLVANMIAALPAGEKHSLDTMAEYANNVQQISAMYVMFMSVVASFGLVRGGQLVLKREQTPEKRKGCRVSGSSSSGDAATSAMAVAEMVPTVAETGQPAYPLPTAQQQTNTSRQ
ncbi:sodium/hydrogen_exchanger (plasmid) [Leishmania braziliensis MHOM/BR/75/M2904]|nr:sodium/hydrogen_exchanger [Leishmania braziliensis MHOM/BR/75/M2904]